MTARIIVADDEADIRRLIVFTLRRRGYDIIEASTGDGALAEIQKTMPDLVVLDVMMPGLTGIEVAGLLAADPATASIPVLLLSAMGQAAEIEAGLSSGAQSYLVKPFIPRELASRVAELLETRPQS